MGKKKPSLPLHDDDYDENYDYDYNDDDLYDDDGSSPCEMDAVTSGTGTQLSEWFEVYEERCNEESLGNTFFKETAVDKSRVSSLCLSPQWLSLLSNSSSSSMWKDGKLLSLKELSSVQEIKINGKGKEIVKPSSQSSYLSKISETSTSKDRKDSVRHELVFKGPNLLDLPPEVISLIIEKVSVAVILDRAQFVCSFWYRLCKNPSLYEVINLTTFTDLRRYFRPIRVNLRLKKMANEAIRKSEKLRELRLDGVLASDDLFFLNLDKFSHLRCFEISCCLSSSYGLTGLFSCSQQLEEVTICMCVLTPQLMEQIGNSCSSIRSFEIACNPGRRHQVLRPGIAGLIVEHLPRIQELVFRRIELCHEDFLVIVNGCLSLENIMAARGINLNIRDTNALRRLQNHWNGDRIVEEAAPVEEKEEVEAAEEDEEDTAELTDQEINCYLPRRSSSY